MIEPIQDRSRPQPGGESDTTVGSTECDQLAEEYQPVTDAVGKTADNLMSVLGMVADELKIGFQRVRKAIDETTTNDVAVDDAS